MRIPGYLSLSLFFLLLAAMTVVPQSRADEPALLSVRGEARLTLPPDQVTLSLGVVTEAGTVEAALDDNNRRMDRVISAIISAGLTKKDYRTSRLQIRPLWSSRPRNPDAGWRAEIIGYRVSNYLQVKTREISSTGRLITLATEAGANQIDNIGFGLSDSRSHRAEAITRATGNARADAEVAAKASGVTIKAVRSFTLDNAEAIDFIAPKRDMQLMRSASSEKAAPPINAGDVTVRAAVSIVYELEP